MSKLTPKDSSNEWDLTATPLILNLKPVEWALWSRRALANCGM